MFYDDKVRLEVNNFEGASTAMQLAESLSESEFEKLLQGKDTTKKRKAVSAAKAKLKKMAHARDNKVRVLCIIVYLLYLL